MKKTLALFLSLQLALLSLAELPALYAASALPVSASSAVLLDPSINRVVYSKTPYKRRAPASTTKLLTALVALEHLRLNQVVRVPKFAESIEASKIYLRAGERYYVRDLIRATLINSANDAAEVLAHAAGGSRTRFAKLMNQKARSLGARHSNFVRASGLPAKNQYSTAYDMALIMKAAQRHPFLVKTLKMKTRTIRSLSGRKIRLRNHNKMLWKDKREVLGKTGWTRRAKHCFVGTIRAYGKKVFVAVLGSHQLWRDLKTLVDYQFGTVLFKIRKNQKLWATADVRRIQLALKRAGYYHAALDGKFGPVTLRAVEKFQKAKRLSVDGIVGPQTYGRLKPYLS